MAADKLYGHIISSLYCTTVGLPKGGGRLPA